MHEKDYKGETNILNGIIFDLNKKSSERIVVIRDVREDEKKPDSTKEARTTLTIPLPLCENEQLKRRKQTVTRERKYKGERAVSSSRKSWKFWRSPEECFLIPQPYAYSFLWDFLRTPQRYCAWMGVELEENSHLKPARRIHRKFNSEGLVNVREEYEYCTAPAPIESNRSIGSMTQMASMSVTETLCLVIQIKIYLSRSFHLRSITSFWNCSHTSVSSPLTQGKKR